MNTWIIGDLQGCADSFEALRQRIHFDSTRDAIYLVGDIVNRGPGSLRTLRWVYQHRQSTFTVLGNHDLHLLWCALGSGTPRGPDTILESLKAPDADELIAWVRQQPLVRQIHQAIIVHAGIHPTWTLQETLTRAEAAEHKLQSEDAGAFLDRMRKRTPANAEDAHLMESLNVLTRMRTLERSDLSLNLDYNGTLADLPEHLTPWFDVPSDHARPGQVFFGHWAALGFHVQTPYIALDSGCVWGNALTAWHLEKDNTVVQPAIDRPVEQTDGERASR